jgi:hypothetical protein
MTGPQGVAKIRDYNCAKVLRMLDSYLAGELTVETNHEILEHLARCLDCASEVKAREELRGAIRRVTLAAQVEPPPELERQVRALVARTPPASRVPHGLFVLAAAAVVFAVGGLLLVSRRGLVGRPEPPAAVYDLAAWRSAAATQKLCALAYDWREGVEPLAEQAAKVGPPYGPELPKIAERLPGWDVLSAHRCEHGGRNVFHVILARKGSTGPEGIASVIAMPKHGHLPPRAAVLAHLSFGNAARSLDARADLLGVRESGLQIAAVELLSSDLVVVSSRPPAEHLEVSRAVLPLLATAIVR